MTHTETIYKMLQKTNKNNPIKCRDMAQQLGIREYDVRCAIAHLRDNGVRIEGSKNGYYLPSCDRTSAAQTKQKQMGPYHVVIMDGNGEIIRDVEFDDHLNLVKTIHIRAKLSNGRNIKL